MFNVSGFFYIEIYSRFEKGNDNCYPYELRQLVFLRERIFFFFFFLNVFDGRFKFFVFVDQGRNILKMSYEWFRLAIGVVFSVNNVNIEWTSSPEITPLAQMKDCVEMSIFVLASAWSAKTKKKSKLRNRTLYQQSDMKHYVFPSQSSISYVNSVRNKRFRKRFFNKQRYDAFKVWLASHKSGKSGPPWWS